MEKHVESITMNMINIGCGKIYHNDWINLDITPKSSDVMAYDLNDGLPFESNSIDVCYSSHVLEHLRKEEADLFIREQIRVLKKNGIVRIAVPDLEMICKNYLKYYDQLVSGQTKNEFRYNFSLLELYDQTVRESSGGELAKYLQRNEFTKDDHSFLVERLGVKATNEICTSDKNVHRLINASPPSSINYLKKYFKKIKYKSAEMMVQILLGRKAVQSLREGIFRSSGEIHRVMYDEYKLRCLLQKHGLIEIETCDASQSRIPDFNSYELDTVDCEQRKPDSLYIEAVRC